MRRLGLAIVAVLTLAACGRTQLVVPLTVPLTGGGSAAGTGGGGGGTGGGGGGGAPGCSAHALTCPPSLMRLGGVVQDLDEAPNAFGTELATDSTGRLVVAYHTESLTGVSTSHVVRATDGGYAALDMPVGGGLDQALALVADVPHLAWVANAGQPPHVSRWSCQGWQELAAVPIVTRGFTPALAATPDGGLLVAAGNQTDATQVAAWTGAAWTLLGDPLDGRYDAWVAADGIGPVISVSHGVSVGSFIEVLRWDGAAWTPVGAFPPSTTGASSSRIAIDPRGRLVVAWLDLQGPYWQVRCARWNGVAWTVLGTPLQPTPGTAYSRPAVAFGPGDEPWLAWRQFLTPDNTNVTSALWVARWTGFDWSLELSNLSARSTESVGFPSLAFDRAGQPLVVWDELWGGRYHVELWSRAGCPLP